MNFAIVGGGLAGVNAASELRRRGYDGDITLIGAEPHPPYDRPPLSKGLLLGKETPESTTVYSEEWFAEHDVDLRTGAPVTGLDTRARTLVTGGETVRYDELLIATGSQPRHLAMADESGADVVYLRTLEDSARVARHLTGSVVIVGAGWIGLEVAAAVREAGGRVTVVEMLPWPLHNVLGDEVAPMFAALHRAHGVDLRLGASVAAISHEGGRTSVRLGDGDVLHPDMVLVGIGAAADDALAAQAGVPTDRGVLADARLATAVPHVFAAGDVAVHDHPVYGRLRVEHWDTAIKQGRHAARSMMGGVEPYAEHPYFFSDQYDVGMEYVGHVAAADAEAVVVRGDPDAFRMTALWIAGGVVAAGMHANDWDATALIRPLLGRPATDAVRDPGVPLADLVTAGDA